MLLGGAVVVPGLHGLEGDPRCTRARRWKLYRSIWNLGIEGWLRLGKATRPLEHQLPASPERRLQQQLKMPEGELSDLGAPGPTLAASGSGLGGGGSSAPLSEEAAPTALAAMASAIGLPMPDPWAAAVPLAWRRSSNNS